MEGPSHWGDLDPAWERCGSGLNQSPVNLADFVESDLAPIAFDYRPGATGILNNGHTVKVEYGPGSTITADGHTYELKQYHFHAPSENTLEGRSFPMEAHFVHADREGHLAVVAVFYEEGAANPLMTRLWDKMPKGIGDKHDLGAGVAAEPLLPAERDYFYFNGSLTTPPCSEGVHWFVMKTPATVSAGQVAAFEGVMHHANNRPVQPLNARRVLQ
jgi:carbonic anhydrase